jgi:hypothetical protein
MADDLVVTGGDIQVGGSNGKIRFNTTDAVLEFTNDGTNWIPLGSKTKKEVLSAEYAGAALVADGSSNVGSMTSDAVTSSPYMNYYEWNSSEVALNDYDVRVRYQLPSDFDGWGSGGIEFNYATESTSSANNKVDIYVYEQTGGIDEPSDLTNVSSSAGVWTTTTMSGANLDVCNAAGEVCVIMIRMYSTNDNYVRVGDIEITYDRKL